MGRTPYWPKPCSPIQLCSRPLPIGVAVGRERVLPLEMPGQTRAGCRSSRGALVQTWWPDGIDALGTDRSPGVSSRCRRSRQADQMELQGCGWQRGSLWVQARWWVPGCTGMRARGTLSLHALPPTSPRPLRGPSFRLGLNSGRPLKSSSYG